MITPSKAKAELRLLLTRATATSVERLTWAEQRKWGAIEFATLLLKHYPDAAQHLLERIEADDADAIQFAMDLMVVELDRRRDFVRQHDQQLAMHYQAHAIYAGQRLDAKLAEAAA